MSGRPPRSAGYIAANKSTGKVIVMIEVPPGSKVYVQAQIHDVLEVVTGRRANTPLYWRRRR